MTVVTKQQLENARLDALTLQAVANGSVSPGTVTSRLGTPLLTLAKIIDDLAGQDVGAGAAALINERIDDLTIGLVTAVQSSEILAIAKSTNAITLSESEFEDLPFYDLDSYYYVTGIGIYKGRNFLVSEPVPQTEHNLYVSNTGNNANPGTDPNAPKLTILNAFATIGSGGGKTIWLEAGTYAENLTFTNKVFTNPVVIRALPGHKVNLRPASGTGLVIFSGNCSNIKFRNISLSSLPGQSGTVVTAFNAISNCGFYDCEFIDSNSHTLSMSISAIGGTNNFDVKRSMFVSGGNWTIDTGNLNNARFIANEMNTNGGITIRGLTLGGNYVVNQNNMRGSIVLNGGTSVVLNCEIKNNYCLAIAHSGGTGGTKSVLAIDNNSVNSTGGGVIITGYTVGGSCSNNNIVAATTAAIAWPNNGTTSDCSGHTISGNNIVRTGSAGDGILIGVGSDDVTLTNNEIEAANVVNCLVLTGSNHEATLNKLYGGATNTLFLKGCSACTVTNNAITSYVASATALNFDDQSSTLPTGNTVTGNTFNVTNGQLYNLDSANIGTGNTVNANIYQIIGAGVWGSLLGAFVNSIEAVRSRWTSQYPSASTNDSTST